MSAKSYIKVSLFIKKLPTISDEQFRKHWKGPHADIALENKTFVRLVRKYNQVCLCFPSTDFILTYITRFIYFRN
jgi:hypothetical protein